MRCVHSRVSVYVVVYCACVLSVNVCGSLEAEIGCAIHAAYVWLISQPLMSI